MLLRTKLNSPKRRDDTLFHPRLVRLLQASLDKPLILLTAPTGYGKTTLLGQFTADALLPVGWYQPDVGDNDSAVFSNIWSNVSPAVTLSLVQQPAPCCRI